MSDKTLPTPGPVEWLESDYWDDPVIEGKPFTISRAASPHTDLVNIFSEEDATVETSRAEAAANAELIAAAFNSAHEAREMGFDPIGAVGQSANALQALEDAVRIIEKNTYPCPDKPNSNWVRLQAMKDILTRARKESDDV